MLCIQRKKTKVGAIAADFNTKRPRRVSCSGRLLCYAIQQKFFCIAYITYWRQTTLNTALRGLFILKSAAMAPDFESSLIVLHSMNMYPRIWGTLQKWQLGEGENGEANGKRGKEINGIFC